MIGLVLCLMINSGFAIMESLHTAASGMEAQKLVIDTLANDFANLNTTGFKKSRVDLQDLHYKTIKGAGTLTSLDTQHPAGIQIGRGVQVSAIHRVFEEGAIKATGNSMDFAIAGQGFFAVLRQGNTYYTRDGSFTRDSNGRIVTKNGFPIQPEITLSAESKGFTVAADGVVTSINSQNATEEIGQIQIVNFVNPSGLSSEGFNLYLPTNASGNAITGTPGSEGLGIVQQGFLEGSNVNAVSGMVDLIAAQRGYELNSKVIQAADQMLQSVTSLR